MAEKFDKKIFNAEAFGQYSRTIENPQRTELIRSGAIVPNREIYDLLQSQVNAYYGRIPYFGNIGGEPTNYEGVTDITADELTTFDRGVIAYGRAKAFTEKDFSHDITANVDFLSEVARQIVDYWARDDQKVMLSVLKGIFSMTGVKNKEFVDKHTYDVSTNVPTKGKIAEDTLNSAIQQACGDNKNKFSLVIMHSAVATNLENINLMKRLTQTDANGIERELTIGTWNGRIVLIDDSMPVEQANKVGEGDTEIPAGNSYTTYVLGQGAIEFGELPVAVPFEMDRDPAKAGGLTTLYTRKRNYIAPQGISYEKKEQANLSPTNTELENGKNWTLVNNGTEYINHKAIAISKIVSRG